MCMGRWPDWFLEQVCGALGFHGSRCILRGEAYCVQLRMSLCSVSNEKSASSCNPLDTRIGPVIGVAFSMGLAFRMNKQISPALRWSTRHECRDSPPSLQK